jgi:hypothetical protein
MRMNITRDERFWRRVEFTESCWLWRGAINGQGYGSYYVGGGCYTISAHRYSYLTLIDSSPTKGLHLDHLCRVRNCVNPWHVEPVLPRVNFERGESPFALMEKRTECKNGHPFTEENMYKPSASRRGRVCAVCSKAYQKAYKARLRAASRA